MGDSPLNAKAGLSVGEFKAGINDMNRSMRVLSSEFKASAAALGDWSKSATGIEQRMGYLNKAIDMQKNKLEALIGQKEAMAREGKLTAAAEAEMTIKINKATEELNGMQRELGENEQSLAKMTQGSDEAGNSVAELGSNSEKASGGMNILKVTAGGLFTALKVGLATVLALVGVVVALTGAIGGLVFTTASSAAELVDLSAKTGITTTRLQELAYVGDQVGTSGDTITASLARLTRSMGSAQEQQADFARQQAEAAANGDEFDGQLGDSAAAFERLGVRTTDASGNLRDNEAVFADLLTALGKIDNESERDALSMSLFGKSAQELNPLIKAGAAEMAALSKQAHDVGAVMAEEDVAAFEAFDDTLASLQAGLKGTVGTLAGAFLPGFQSVFNQAGGYLKEFSAIVRGSDGNIGQIATGVTGLIQKIITDIATQAPSLLQSGLAILQTIIASIVTSLPAMLPVGIQILTSLITFIVQNLPALIGVAVQIILALVQGLNQAIPTLIPLIATVIPQIINVLIENFPLLITAALMLITALAMGLTDAMPILIQSIPPLVEALVQTLIANGPLLLTAGGLLILALINGFGTMVLELGKAAGELFKVFLDAISPNWADNTQKLMLTGYNIVQGVWKGIQGAKDWFYGQIKGFFAGLVGTVMNAIGAHSPADAFMPAGKYMLMGVGEGAENELPALQKKIGAAMRGLAQNYDVGVNANLSGGASGSAGGGNVINLGGITIQVGGSNASSTQIGQAAENGVLRALRAAGAA